MARGLFTVSFYSTGGAEIISIDAFNKSENSNEFVIGITIIKVYANISTFCQYFTSCCFLE